MCLVILDVRVCQGTANCLHLKPGVLTCSMLEMTSQRKLSAECGLTADQLGASIAQGEKLMQAGKVGDGYAHPQAAVTLQREQPSQQNLHRLLSSST